jgi:glutamine amidotransferase-like uncharacterized protein
MKISKKMLSLSVIDHTLKVKFTKKQQKEIAKIRKIIAAHHAEQDKLVDGFIESMGFLGKEPQDTIVWDYIYNDSQWMVELE